MKYWRQEFVQGDIQIHRNIETFYIIFRKEIE